VTDCDEVQEQMEVMYWGFVKIRIPSKTRKIYI